MNRTNWQLSILDRRTQTEIMKIPRFNATGTYSNNNVNAARISFPPDVFEQTSIRAAGHWVWLQNLEEPRASLYGPITQARYDLDDEEGREVNLTVSDWMAEPLEQVVFDPIAAIGNPIEMAKLLLKSSKVSTPMRVVSHATEGVFPLMVERYQTIGDWWSTLGLLLPWNVEARTLVLGRSPAAPIPITQKA